MSKQVKRVPVSSRAVIQRINRKLARNDQALKTSRGAKAENDLGVYYLLDVNRNFVVNTHIDLEHLGRHLGVLAAWETVIDE